MRHEEANVDRIRQDIDTRPSRRLRSTETQSRGRRLQEALFRASVARPQRDELDALLEFIREDDVVVVIKLDRLARSVRDLLEIVARIEAKGASLRILAMQRVERPGGMAASRAAGGDVQRH